MKRAALVIAACFAGGLFAADYAERYRPQFHFSPKTNWTNDPCGLVYAFGKYHLFFQHNPFANVWGHMSWGHAVSTDLVHWQQLPVAIPDDEKVAIFTGSSVVDEHNTSGLCQTGPKGCIVSIYTGNSPKHETQNLAYSQDGVTWTKYSGNPVLDLGKADTRDPKVFWHEPTRRWIMAIVQADSQKVLFFGSPNLIKWEHLSDFGPQAAVGGQWECPDLVRVQQHWVLKVGLNPGHIAGGSGEQYFIGDFDGASFKSDNPNAPVKWADYGRDSYCALTFNNDPKGPQVIGWMSNWQYAGTAPTSPWRGAMTLPRSLSLADTSDGLRLIQTPIAALRSLRGESFHYEGSSQAELNRKLAAWPRRSQTFEIEMTVEPAQAVGLRLLGVSVGFDPAKNVLFVDRPGPAFHKTFPSRTEAPLTLSGEPLKLHIFADTSSVEVFAQNGRISMTNLVFPETGDTAITLTGASRQIDFKMWKLRSTWKQAAK